MNSFKCKTLVAYHPACAQLCNLEAGTTGTAVAAVNLPKGGEERYWFTPDDCTEWIKNHAETYGYLFGESELGRL